MSTSPQRNRASAQQACFAAQLLMEHVLRGCAETMAQAGVRADFDVPDDLLVHGHFAELSEILRALLLRAVVRSEPGDQIDITVVEEADGIAFEVSDERSLQVESACADDEGNSIIAGRIGPVSWSELSDIQTLADRCGGTLRQESCPQGGSAITLRVPRRPRQRRAAA